ncbi:hypothetical protein Tsubulata_036289 [Turnera subulata]|uniref:PGG domain-containing protein n=1 Tax=Turnera subulata TaxID=218843 RepID=A0A9Q0F9Q4_9ROSI|nr:hypothetical protein Tsubulata_036289 [Turnera subulata]
MDPALPQYHFPINYKDWSIEMRTYLINQDVWYRIVELALSTNNCEPNNNGNDQLMDHKTWRDKNAMALRAIHASCAPTIPPQLVGVTSAKIAWETLAKLDQFKQRGITPSDPRYSNPLLDVNLVGYEAQEFELSFGPLISAIWRGDWGAILGFIQSNPRILTSIISYNGHTPIHEATSACQAEIARRLVELMSEEELEIQSTFGHTPLHLAAHVGSTAIARLLIQKNKKLVQIPGVDGKIPVVVASGSGHKDTTRYLYSCTPIELLYPESLYGEVDLSLYCITNGMLDIALDLFQKCPRLSFGHKNLPTSPMNLLASNPSAFYSGCRLGIGKRWIYSCYRANGIEEIVIQIFKACPDINAVDVADNQGRDLIMLAIAFRQEKIFNLLLSLRSTYGKVNIQDYDRNNMPPPPEQLARISGAALQIIVQQSFSEFVNKFGDTPRQLFTRNHKQLRDDGEKWMKETASSCTVVGALIITIMFAVAFTVPGGNFQDSGFPEEKKLSDAIALFSSSTSVLMFLGILTSRYTEDDFLISLPRKLIIGLSTLFVSIAAMMVAFCATIIIMLHGRLSVIIPACLLAGIPVSLFVILQFPLLVEIFNSTYIGIFSTEKKAKIE